MLLTNNTEYYKSAVRAILTLHKPLPETTQKLLIKKLPKSSGVLRDRMDLALTLVALGDLQAATVAVDELIRIFEVVADELTSVVVAPEWSEDQASIAATLYQVKNPARVALLKPLIPLIISILSKNISTQFRTNLVVDLGVLGDTSPAVVETICQQYQIDDDTLKDFADSTLEQLGVDYASCSQFGGLPTPPRRSLRDVAAGAQFAPLHIRSIKNEACNLIPLGGTVDSATIPTSVSAEYSKGSGILKLHFDCNDDRQGYITYFCLDCADGTSQGEYATSSNSHIFKVDRGSTYKAWITCIPESLTVSGCGAQLILPLP